MTGAPRRHRPCFSGKAALAGPVEMLRAVRALCPAPDARGARQAWDAVTSMGRRRRCRGSDTGPGCIRLRPSVKRNRVAFEKSYAVEDECDAPGPRIPRTRRTRRTRARRRRGHRLTTSPEISFQNLSGRLFDLACLPSARARCPLAHAARAAPWPPAIIDVHSCPDNATNVTTYNPAPPPCYLPFHSLLATHPTRLCIATTSSTATTMADSPVRAVKDIQVWGHRGASAFLPENT